MSPSARMLRPHVVRRWKALAGAGAATGALTLADLAKPWPLALLVDRMLAREAPFTLDAADVRTLALLAAAVLAIAIVEALAQYASDMWLQVAGERITHDLRLRVYDHLQRLSLGYHQRRQKGDLVTRVTGDVNAMGDLFSQSLGAIVQSALLALGMTVVLLVIDPVLALVSLATAPLTMVLSYVYRHRVRARARERRAHEGEIASVANEALSAMAVVKAFGSEGYESRRVREGSERRLAAGVEVARLQARFDGLVGTVRAVSTAVVLVVGAVRVSHGAISAGELLVFASYTRKAQSPLRSFARELTKVAAAMAKADRLAELLGSDEVLEERADAYAAGRAAGDVALEEVVFAYGGERPALDGVTLRVCRGERVALTGPSGAGKSTLGALVARLFDPGQGRVLIDGRDVRECSLTWLREQVALVLQDTVLFSGTVHDNIAYATDATREQVEAAARAAAADGFVEALPAGYDTDLGPQGVALSGGQRQRIGIARTLLRDPPILVLDEPTTGLDRASEDAVLAGLEALMRGRTTLLITHSERLASTADRVVELAGGRLAAPRAAVPGAATTAGPGAAPASGAATTAGPGAAPASGAATTAGPGAAAASGAALPLAPLLDAGASRALLERALGDGARLGDVAVGRVAYKPGESVAVHYRAEVDGTPRDAVAAAGHAGRRRDAGRPAAKARSVAPPWFDEELGVLVTWLPFDPKLPALAEAPGELGRRLGIDVPGEPALVGYKPRARAVLRSNGHVLKAYGAPRQFEAALAGLRAASAGPLPTGALAGADPELRLVAQRAVEGRRPGSAQEVAEVAGALAAELARSGLEGLPLAPPEKHLRSAARKGALIADVLPELRPRVDALVDRLARERPTDLPAVPAHGDFHVDQLLVADRRSDAARGRPPIAVVDFDQMCLAAPALDVATYAADVVRGRDGDLEAVGSTLEAFLSGYGAPPDALGWHLAVAILGRAAHPFHRQLPSWPDRVEAMLRAAERVRG